MWLLIKFCILFLKNTIILKQILMQCIIANEENVNEDIRKSDRYQLVRGNLCSYDLVKHIFESNKITHVIHFLIMFKFI